MLDTLLEKSCAATSRLLNQLCAYDPDAEASLERIEGKAIAIVIHDLSLHLHIHVNDGKIVIKPGREGTADASLSGQSEEFIKLLKGGNDVLNADIHYQGNVQVGQQFQRFFTGLDIDWEDWLSQYTGEVAARQISLGLNTFSTWAKKGIESLKLNAKEFIVEESRASPHYLEVDEFYEKVDDLRDDVDRLEAKIKRYLAS